MTSFRNAVRRRPQPEHRVFLRVRSYGDAVWRTMETVVKWPTATTSEIETAWAIAADGWLTVFLDGASDGVQAVWTGKCPHVVIVLAGGHTHQDRRNPDGTSILQPGAPVADPALRRSAWLVSGRTGISPGAAGLGRLVVSWRARLGRRRGCRDHTDPQRVLVLNDTRRRQATRDRSGLGSPPRPKVFYDPFRMHGRPRYAQEWEI